MAENIFGLVICLFIGVPLLYNMIQTIKGKRIITRKELSFSWICVMIFLGLIMFRLITGSGISSIGFCEIYFIVLAIVETIAYKKQE